MKPTHRLHAFLFGSAILASLAIGGSLQAATILTVTDTRPGETAVTVASTTAGSVSVSGTKVPTSTYTVSGLDLTSFGGGAGETLVFNVTYSQTGGTGVQVNGFGNISVTGGDNNQVDGAEVLTATVSLISGSSTYTGDYADLSIGFIRTFTGGVDSVAAESWDIITASGTQSFTGPGNTTANFAPSSFVSLDPDGSTVNLQEFDVQISYIPEPSTALLGGLGLLALLRRRRA